MLQALSNNFLCKLAKFWFRLVRGRVIGDPRGRPEQGRTAQEQGRIAQ